MFLVRELNWIYTQSRKKNTSGYLYTINKFFFSKMWHGGSFNCWQLPHQFQRDLLSLKNWLRLKEIEEHLTHSCLPFSTGPTSEISTDCTLSTVIRIFFDQTDCQERVMRHLLRHALNDIILVNVSLKKILQVAFFH